MRLLLDALMVLAVITGVLAVAVLMAVAGCVVYAVRAGRLLGDRGGEG